MHEFGIVQALVHQLLARLDQQQIEGVEAIRFRRGSAFSEAVLRQAFVAVSTGTILEGAELSIETVNLDYRCGCGHRQVITSDDLIGHMFVCPSCGAIKEIDEAHDLELIDVTVRQADTLDETKPAA